VLSSRREGSPNAAKEAGVPGVLVVFTQCPGGPRKTLENGRYGPPVPVEDPSAYALSMMRTLDAAVPGEIL